MLHLSNRFSAQLPADDLRTVTPRQVYRSCYSWVTPRVPSSPALVHVSEEAAALIGLSVEETESEAFLQIFSGAKVPDGWQPYAMCYGGHQFGHWAGQLGDGRAINLAEVEHEGQVWALQLKGAGLTPYSRRADGLAVLRSSIREHLCSEAMFHLGVPTTRSLSLVLTGDEVLRDVMYDGNPAYEKGAIVCRMAPSFIRFGSFEIFAARGEVETLRQLADFTIRHFFPQIKTGTSTAYVDFFREVARRTLALVMHWQRVGFVHGVMNTDNLSILGLTVDYGPYGWLEGYEPGWTPNTTDRQQKRYQYGQQPQIALWNLYMLANALYPLVEETAPFESILEAYRQEYARQYPAMWRQKLGLAKALDKDRLLIAELLDNLERTETDMTIFFRRLSAISKHPAQTRPEDFIDIIRSAFYQPDELNNVILEKWQQWFVEYQSRLAAEPQTDSDRQAAMNRANPKYVLRNYMAQLAIDDAEKGDYALIEELYHLLKRPYDEQPDKEKWFAKRPEWARDRVGCSMLSCSS